MDLAGFSQTSTLPGLDVSTPAELEPRKLHQMIRGAEYE